MLKRTLRRYENAVRLFFAWMAACVGQMPERAGSLDAVLADYAEVLWEEGESRSLLGDTLSGLSHFIKMLKGRLPDAWRQHDVWNKLEPAKRATPLTLPILLSLVGVALAWEDHAIAAGMLVAFQGLLRTGELLGLVKADFSFDLKKGQVVINLGLTKGGKRRNESEEVLVRDRTLTALLFLILEKKRPGDRLMPAEKVFRARFAEYLQYLQLHGLNFKPYSLRRGGATHLFYESGSMETVRVRGRWQNFRTAKQYVEECRVATTEMALTTLQRQKIERWKKHAVDFLVG